VRAARSGQLTQIHFNSFLYSADLVEETIEGMASDIPSDTPSMVPLGAPSSFILSDYPSLSPSNMPSDLPSLSPSNLLSDYPSLVPIIFPSLSPVSPGDETSDGLTFISRDMISGSPSSAPTDSPSAEPQSSAPRDVPGDGWSGKPSSEPRGDPSTAPSDAPNNSQGSGIQDVVTSAPLSAPSETPSLSPFASPNPGPAPSIDPSDVPSVVPSSMPSDLPSQGPSDFGFDALPGIGKGGEDTTSRDAPAIEDGGTTTSSSTFWGIVGGAATGGALLAMLLLALLFVRHRSRERSASPESQLPICIPGSGENEELQGGILSISMDSRFKPNSTASFAVSRDDTDMLPLSPIRVPSIVESVHDEVNSEMSPMSATVNAKEESGLCGCLEGANSEDAYVDGLENPSFAATDTALNDLLAAEKCRSNESQSQNSSLEGLQLVGSKSKEAEGEGVVQNSTIGFLKGVLGLRKEKPPLRDQAHYFNNDQPCKSDEVSYDFEEHQRPKDVVSDVDLATASNVMTPKRSNRSNGSFPGSPRRFFRGSGNRMFEDSTKL